MQGSKYMHCYYLKGREALKYADLALIKFSLNEWIQGHMNESKCTYSFLDVKKAQDTVWRDGLRNETWEMCSVDSQQLKRLDCILHSSVFKQY